MLKSHRAATTQSFVTEIISHGNMVALVNARVASPVRLSPPNAGP